MKTKYEAVLGVLTYRYIQLLLKSNVRLLKAYICTKNCIQMFPGPQLETTQSQISKKTGEGINTFQYIHSMQYYYSYKKVQIINGHENKGES